MEKGFMVDSQRGSSVQESMVYGGRWGFQNPIIKEYTLNHIGDPIKI